MLGSQSNSLGAMDAGSTAERCTGFQAAEADDADDGSLYEDSSVASLRSSIRELKIENGRTYHSVSEGKYNFPNDGDENIRLDFQDYIARMALDGALALCPGHETAKRVLDMGTGTGNWALDFADAFPSSEVIGVDLSPIQAEWTPPNLSFVIDDLEKPWTWVRPFDFIHCRSMDGCFSDHAKMIRQVYDSLAPGGWFEVASIFLPLGCDDDSVPGDAPLRRWHELLAEAAARAGRPLEGLGHHPDELQQAGFVGLTRRDFIWPLNTWPKDDKLKEMGMWQFVNLDMGLEGLSLGLFTRVLGWSQADVVTLCEEVREDLRNKKMHAYWRIARKVKCDEAKPKCVRCTSSGRQCAGYEPTPDHGLAWYRPQQLTAHDQREGRAFQFFSHMVGPVLSGPTDPYFWTHLVVQFSHFEPAVRHAVLAISALYEDFHDGARVTRQKRGNAFALSHYSAAIERVKRARDEQLVLLACILFVCVEYLQGDVEAALRHCKHGILILNKVGCSTWARDYLLPIFRRLSFISFFMGVKPADDVLVPGLVGFDVPLPPRFRSVAEAQNAIDHLTMCAIETVVRGDGDGAAGREPLDTRLQEFMAKVGELDATIPPEESAKKMSICAMMIKTEMARIQVATIDGDSEMRYDEWADSYRNIVALARRAAELQAASPPDRPRASFTFEQGFLSMMGFVSIKCRDLRTRLEALDLMLRLPAAKESLLDVGTIYRVGRRGAELEHGVSLDDGLLEGDPEAMARVSFPPEEKRLLGAPIEHELDVLKNEDGSVTYRRTAHYIWRGADGETRRQTEYLLDRKPGQKLSPDLPSMRCSKPL
ncbi:putative methyltransferase tdiE [Colletotrichum sidae]|uniref:Putative methyltransferase tdiE n=1 Tax=Colletotrichum sidae TaxID=1347389 RepID=A0A4R8T3I9_9PEZI|nr:putative methyltransferase tdiE [Colletotrichum sidae]